MTTAYIIENRILLTRDDDDQTRIAQRLCGMLRSSIVPSAEGLYRTVGYPETLLLKSKGLQHAARYTDEDQELTWAAIEKRLGIEVGLVVNVDTGMVDGIHCREMQVTALDPHDGMRPLWHHELGALLTIEAPNLSGHGRSPIFSLNVDRPCDPTRTMLHIHEDHLEKLQKYGQAKFDREHCRAGRQMAGTMKLCLALRARWYGEEPGEDIPAAELDMDLKAVVERASPRAPLRIAA